MWDCIIYLAIGTLIWLVNMFIVGLRDIDADEAFIAWVGWVLFWPVMLPYSVLLLFVCWVCQ